MRKVFCVIFLAFTCTTAFANNPLRVILGKSELKSLMKENAIICLQMDWSEATYDNEIGVKEKFGEDLDYIMTDCDVNMLAGFNEHSKGLKMQLEEDDAKEANMVLR